MELRTERRKGSYTSGTSNDYGHDALCAHALMLAILDGAAESRRGVIIYPDWYFNRVDELMAQWAKENGR